MGQIRNALFMLSEDKQTVTQVYWSLGSRLWSFSEGFSPPDHIGRGWITI